jgi:nicotinate-nucleotide--dimethylbenzimidazole phosphoribosyltransferase
MTVLVDGFISGVAALAASMMDPSLPPALLLSHVSSERGAEVLLGALRRHGVELPPPLLMEMRLGEGTGALLCLPILKGACDVLRDMGSLADTLALVGGGRGGAVPLP